MKRLLITTTLLALSTSTLAEFTNSEPQPKRFGDVGNQLSTIAQVQKLNDNSHVILEGYIVKQLSNDDYTFKDNAGDTITIELEDNVWNGLNVSEKDKIRITGEVDKEWSKTQIDVYQIEKIQ
ncbi:hypothetical protein A4G18_07905 [Pasteurellaceae bacterium Pebbles2]|nr:hypothetical protein [Pasteurellaceae bacterium Pebbles2]